MQVSREPARWLRPYVRRFYGFQEATGVRTQRREGPGAEVVVLLSFEGEWRIGAATDPARPSDRRTSFAAGLHDASVLTEHDGLAHGMQVSLTPPGAYSLFGVPMSELAGRTVPLDALFGKDADRLAERLVSTPGWPARLALLDAAISARLAEARPPSPAVAWAWQRLSQTHGRVRVGALVEELGWSRKRLVARFREEIGISPKSLARILRFERAAALLAQPDPPGFADLAYECGFYDQSHLTNEFRRITGVTPAAFVAGDSDTFLQDVARDSS
jgi:AraC-like DNA-binding protein